MMPHTRTGGYARVISDGTLRSARLTIVGSGLLSEVGLEMSHAALTVPDMNEPPRRHDITIRVDTGPGRHHDPAAFAVTAGRAAAAQGRERSQRAHS